MQFTAALEMNMSITTKILKISNDLEIGLTLRLNAGDLETIGKSISDFPTEENAGN